MGDVSPGFMGITSNTIRAFDFLRREWKRSASWSNTSKTVAPPPKGHAPTAKNISLLESGDARVAEKERVTVVGVPIGADEYVLKRAREIVKEGGTEHLARCHANMPDKKATALIVIESLG